MQARAQVESIPVAGHRAVTMTVCRIGMARAARLASNGRAGLVAPQRGGVVVGYGWVSGRQVWWSLPGVMARWRRLR